MNIKLKIGENIQSEQKRMLAVVGTGSKQSAVGSGAPDAHSRRLAEMLLENALNFQPQLAVNDNFRGGVRMGGEHQRRIDLAIKNGCIVRCEIPTLTIKHGMNCGMFKGVNSKCDCNPEIKFTDEIGDLWIDKDGLLRSDKP